MHGVPPYCLCSLCVQRLTTGTHCAVVKVKDLLSGLLCDLESLFLHTSLACD